MAHELVIRTKIIRAGGIDSAAIGIDRGVISEVAPDLSGDREFHFEDYLALPGGVDIHTHMREPGFERKEDFFTGTRSAAFGGTTTILDMPNTDPATDRLANLEGKLDLITGKANVDFGLMAQLSDIDEIERMAPLVTGFKLFMSETTSATRARSLEVLLNSPHLTGRVVTVHAEDPELFSGGSCNDLHGHNLVRNMRAESEAVRRILSVSTPARLNLAHLTTADCVDMARRGKASFEITPHHALLDETMDIGARGKVNPPLRKRAVAERLMDVLRSGRAIIASDHAPHTLEEKSGEFSGAPSGLPGVETRIPLMLALAQKGVLKHSAVQDMCCQLPADLFGMSKGRLAPGYDADMAFYDLNNMVKIDASKLHSKCGWSPFEGFDAIFPVGVMLRGRMIIRGGQLVVENQGQKISLGNDM